MSKKWPSLKLEEIADIQAGGTPSRTKIEYWENGTIPWVKIGDIKGKYVNCVSEHITPQGVKNSAAKIFKKNTILYTIFATLGEVSILNFDATTNQAIAGIVPNETVVISDYLYFYLKSIKESVIDAGRGVAQNNINLSILRNFNIPLPPLSEQKRIAEILDTADSIRQKRKAAITKLDELAQSIFIEMFGDPVKNEKGWRCYKLKDFANVRTGATPSRKEVEKYYKNGSIPWVKTTEIKGIDIESTEELITTYALKETNCKLFPVNTILLAMYGQGKTRGQVGMLKIEAATNQACAAIIPSEQINTLYLYNLLSNSYLYLRNLSRGGNQENLNLNIVSNYIIPVPPMLLQQRFATIISENQKIKTQHQHALAKEELLFSSLQHQAFSGEL